MVPILVLQPFDGSALLRQFSRSLPPHISASSSMSHIYMAGWSVGGELDGKTSCCRGGVFVFHFSGPSFASCACSSSACWSLSSQCPILHHRWGRQKGEATARLLFGEMRSVQLSERRGEGADDRKEGAVNVICLHIANDNKICG